MAMTPCRCPTCDLARSLHALLMADDVDGAIEAGLMSFAACDCTTDDVVTITSVMQAQARLRTAWEARRRYRLRQARLARRAQEREARRLAAAPATTDTASSAPERPALPASAAAILARAKAKAADRMKR